MRLSHEYMGTTIHRNTRPGHALRWSALGYGAADTLAGMRDLIRDAKGGGSSRAMPGNLERHPSHAGTWIAYDADGRAFRVRKVSGRYLASPSHAGQDADARRLTGRLLRDVAATVAASRMATVS